MRVDAGQSFGRGSRVCIGKLMSCGHTRCKLPQNRINEWGSGAFSGSFYQLDAFVDCRALRNAIQPAKLVETEAQRDENLQVKLGQRLRGSMSDLIIQQGTPSENAHHQFGS